MDPNRDFPYQQDPGHCMTTITVRREGGREGEREGGQEGGLARPIGTFETRPIA